MLRMFLLLEIVAPRVQTLMSPAFLLIFNVSNCQLCALWIQIYSAVHVSSDVWMSYHTY